MTQTRDRVRIEHGAKRIRVMLDGEIVADTRNVKLVWERPYYPTYYFPANDVRTDLLVATGDTKRSPSRGNAEVYTVKTGRGEAADAAFHYADSPVEEIDGYYAFDWDAMEAWFEEDEQVYTHPRDPYTRIDILPSSRHIEIVVDGVKVADSVRPRLLFETGLVTRYYLPKTDVRMDLLIPTDLQTHCPYKGTASYYSVDTGEAIHENLVWWYPTPLPESTDIAGLVAFYNHKVDLYIDGELDREA